MLLSYVYARRLITKMFIESIDCRKGAMLYTLDSIKFLDSMILNPPEYESRMVYKCS